MTEQNIEHKSLVQCASGLTDLLQHNILSVSAKLLEKGLVTKDVHDSVLYTEGVSSHNKAAKLVSCVTDRVKGSARRFHDFIDVLKGDSYFDDIVQEITSIHSKFSDRHELYQAFTQFSSSSEALLDAKKDTCDGKVAQ